ncbi:MAG TPA: cupin domain-containing protein [Candidatus Lokiarchaeia archaeon]|nr:cupin domain-containing protein [Candidatus Lokiarchaeia archaeon]
MNIIPASSTTKGLENKFTGDVYIDVIVKGEEPSRVRVNSVHFTPGARTAWHSHAVGQTLHVTEGIGLAQARDEEIIVIRPGDTIYIPPGEWHWHGAAKDHFMTHLAIWEAPEAGPESEWGDLVTDDEYGKQPEI